MFFFYEFNYLPQHRNQCSSTRFTLNSFIGSLFLLNTPRSTYVTMLSAFGASVSQYFQLFSAWNIMVLMFQRCIVMRRFYISYKQVKMTYSLPEACSTMRAPVVLSSAFSLNASARQGACKRSLFKSIGVSPENQRWLSKQ